MAMRMLKNKIVKSDNFKKADKLIVTLHGYGTCGDDFAEVGEIFLRRKIDNAVFIFPDAPEKCDAGFGRQWFRLDKLDFEELHTGLLKTAPILKNFIEAQIREFRCGNIYLIGFSQGAIMALEMMFHMAISKIISYSGLFCFSQKSQLVSKPDVLLVHSVDDPVVPYKNALNAKSSLENLEIPVSLETYYSIGHSISVEAWECGVDFLKIP